MTKLLKSVSLLQLLIFSLALIPSAERPPGAEIVIGEIKQLLVAVDYEPFWSPDGRRIVFISNRNGPLNVYTMNADGSDVFRLTNHSGTDDTPAYSPDGKQIAFVSERDGNSEIYLINSDGSNLRRLTNEPAEDLHPTWSVDGRRILFNSSRPVANRSNPERFDVYTMSASNGSDIKRLTDGGVNTYASFSPDGKYILFRRSAGENLSEIVITDAIGKNPRVLSKEKVFDGWCAWSPDGERIVFSSNRSGDFQIYAMNADGTRTQRLIERPGRFTNPRWSPDGSRIMFTGRTERDTRIFIAEVNDKNAVR